MHIYTLHTCTCTYTCTHEARTSVALRRSRSLQMRARSRRACSNSCRSAIGSPSPARPQLPPKSPPPSDSTEERSLRARPGACAVPGRSRGNASREALLSRSEATSFSLLRLLPLPLPLLVDGRRSRRSRLSLAAAWRWLGDAAKAGEVGIPDRCDGELVPADDFAWADGDDGRRLVGTGAADWGRNRLPPSPPPALPPFVASRSAAQSTRGAGRGARCGAR